MKPKLKEEKINLFSHLEDEMSPDWEKIRSMIGKSSSSEILEEELEKTIMEELEKPDEVESNIEEKEEVTEPFVKIEKKKKIKFNLTSISLAIIAVLSCVISAVLTIRFMNAIRGESDWITVGLGAMWELSKYSFVPIIFLHPSRTTKAVLTATAAVLIAGSMAASVGFLTDLNESIQTSSMTSSVEYQDLQNERNILKNQMDTLLLSAHEDTKRSFRRRGLETNTKIEDLRKKYTELGEKMVELRNQKVQIGFLDSAASLIVSFMLEICGILAISLFTQKKEEVF